MVHHRPAAGNGPLPQSATFAYGSCRGEVRHAFAEPLAALLAQLPDRANLAVVKQSTVRTVLLGTFGGICVHVKLYRSGTLSDRARDAMRGERGQREARNLLAAAGLGLATVEPLAHGTCDGPDGKQSFLVTRTVAGSTRFSFSLPAVVLQKVGAMLRQAHDLGFLPADLHPGNIVIDGSGSPWLLDLTSVRHSGDPDTKRRAAALAFFCQELDGGPLDPCAQPLLAAYCGQGRPLPAGFADALAQAARSVRLSALVAFGRRSSRACRHTELGVRRRGVPRWHWHLSGSPQLDAELRAACESFAAAMPEPTKQGRRGAVWLLDRLVAKQRDQGAARKLFTAMYWLHFAGVAQPAPVALRTFDGTGHVFTARIAAPDLRTEMRTGTLHGRALLAAARELGTAVGRLHAHGLRNRDLKLVNLVRDPHSGLVCMADLDGVLRKRPSDSRGQGRDLGRLLAAFRGEGSPGGLGTVLAFTRAYQRARARLLQPAVLHKLWRVATQRACEWASAHR